MNSMQIETNLMRSPWLLTNRREPLKRTPYGGVREPRPAGQGGFREGRRSYCIVQPHEFPTEDREAPGHRHETDVLPMGKQARGIVELKRCAVRGERNVRDSVPD